MLYFSLYYHFVWHTKNSSPYLRGDNEKEIHKIIKSIVFNSPDMFFDAIGGTATHIHVVLHSKSTITVAQMAHKMKGTSSEMINERGLFRFRFSWQHEYGCVAFSENDLHIVQDYVAKQYEHHQRNTIEKRLECTDSRELGLKHAWGNDE
jgi:putative transposase